MTKLPATYRQWVIASPVTGDAITPDQFAMHELPIPALDEGQALVRIKLINLHSRTRLRIPTTANPDAPGTIRPGETDLSNYGCVEVIASRDATFRVGDVIHCQVGWQDYQVISSTNGPIGYPPPMPAVRALNGTSAPMSYAFRPHLAQAWSDDVLMHVFGTSGMTAYFGLRECGPVTPRDRVLVAGASGSVGSLVAQLAKARGAYVVGLAGGEDRCRWVVETLGIDACIDYRAPDLETRLRAAFPQGIDLFSDGIGGDLTPLVVSQMNDNARLFSYGSSAAFYGAGGPMAGGGMRRSFGISEAVEEAARQRNIHIECWLVFDFYDERLRAEDDMSRLLLQGRLKAVTSVTQGFENLPQAVVDMYARPRAGKAQVRFEA